ncbi:MAG: ribosome silencing factor [Bacilli bacterium]|nr:ribosome silencing factor [Bacilli bacterium]
MNSNLEISIKTKNELISAVESLKSCNAKDIKIYDLRGYSPFFDFAIIATAVGERQINALESHIEKEAKENDFLIRNIVGRNSEWLLVDLYDVMVNFFTLEERTRFDLDKMWASRLVLDEAILLNK